MKWIVDAALAAIVLVALGVVIPSVLVDFLDVTYSHWWLLVLAPWQVFVLSSCLRWLAAQESDHG